MVFHKILSILSIVIFVGSVSQDVFADRVVRYTPCANKYLILQNFDHFSMLENHAKALNRILQNMHVETNVETNVKLPETERIELTNPDIQSLQIVIGHFSRINSNHPCYMFGEIKKCTHRDNKTFDVDYLTLGKDNRTEYGCNLNYCREYHENCLGSCNEMNKWDIKIDGWVKLYYEEEGERHVKDEDTKRWEDPYYVRDRAIYYGFDWKRNWLFYKKIHDVFPECRVVVNPILRQNIRDHLKLDSGLSDREIHDLFGSWLVGDSLGNAHHLHAHIELGDAIDYDALANLAYYGPDCFSEDDDHECYDDIQYD